MEAKSKIREASHGHNTLMSVALAAFSLSVAAAGFAQAGKNDWELLWQPNGAVLPSPSRVHIGSLGDLGADLENRDWLMVETRHHQLLFQDSIDRGKVAELYQLLDRLYVFLEGRSPAKPMTPLQVFLVPNQRGHSRCSPEFRAMRTGDQGELAFLLTSLLHEETHLFNFAFLGARAQGWWSGEFSCIYFQERARLQHEGRDLRQELRSRLPQGPLAHLADLDARGKSAFDEALAAQIFFEDKFGRERFDKFRRQSLLSAQRTNGGRLPGAVFQEVFGKDALSLDAEWRKFFGWGPVVAEARPAAVDARLETKVTYTVQQESVQYVVQRLAGQAGLDYNFDKSRSQTDPLCRRWVNNLEFKDKTCREALDTLLAPLGLRYEIEADAVVLYRK
jgi:hypothetical protein